MHGNYSFSLLNFITQFEFSCTMLGRSLKLVSNFWQWIMFHLYIEIIFHLYFTYTQKNIIFSNCQCPHTFIVDLAYVQVFSSVQPRNHISLPSHEKQHARPPCPSPTPRVHSDSRPSSPWCHPAISSSVVPFSSCPQSFPASGSLQMSQLFASGGQSIGLSASASVLPVNIQDWFPLGLLVGSPCSPRDSQESSPTPQFKSINSSVLSFL